MSNDPTRAERNARFDNAVNEHVGLCGHCRQAYAANGVTWQASEACARCGYIQWRMTPADQEYYTRWIAWNQVGGVLYGHQDKPLPPDRDPR